MSTSKSDKLQYWWYNVQSSYVDGESLIVLIYDDVK